MRKLILARTGLAITMAILVHTARAQNSFLTENVDHAGIISHWDSQSLQRGQGLFQIACAPCHGMNGVQTLNPQARPFAVEKFKNGSDPYSMFKTITRGFKGMPSQTWMTPEQRYEVIQFIRETFVKKLNPTQHTKVDQAYLDSLPKFDPALARSAAASKVKPCDFGPVLESQLGSNFGDVLTFHLKDNVSLSYDLHHMRLAGAWQGGFLNLSRTGHSQQRGEGQPLPEGKPLRGLQQWYWAFGGRFDYPTNDLLPRGPLPAGWMKYQGHYVYNRQAILSFTIEGRQVLEWPDAEKNNDFLMVSHTLRIGSGSTAMRLCVGQLESARARIQGLVAFGQTVPKARSGFVAGHLVMAAEATPGADSGSVGQSYGDFVAAGALGLTKGLTWEVDDQQRLVLNIPADDKPRVVRVFCSSGNGASALKRFGQHLSPELLT
jgi:hypothetical protein